MVTKKRTILVIEDEVSLLNALCDKLMREDFTMFMAKNGKEGLQIALREHPDLILLDIVMPVMDGMAVLKKLREDEWGKNVRVIILTNLSDTAKIAESMDGGAYEYFVKTDWKLEKIVEKIKERLARE